MSINGNLNYISSYNVFRENVLKNVYTPRKGLITDDHIAMKGTEIIKSQTIQSCYNIKDYKTRITGLKIIILNSFQLRESYKEEEMIQT